MKKHIKAIKKAMQLAIAHWAYQAQNHIPSSDDDYIIEAQMQNSNPCQMGENLFYGPVEAHDLDEITRALTAVERGDYASAKKHVIDAAWYKTDSNRWLKAKPSKDFKKAIAALLAEWVI